MRLREYLKTNRRIPSISITSKSKTLEVIRHTHFCGMRRSLSNRMEFSRECERKKKKFEERLSRMYAEKHQAESNWTPNNNKRCDDRNTNETIFPKLILTYKNCRSVFVKPIFEFHFSGWERKSRWGKMNVYLPRACYTRIIISSLTTSKLTVMDKWAYTFRIQISKLLCILPLLVTCLRHWFFSCWHCHCRRRRTHSFR